MLEQILGKLAESRGMARKECSVQRDFFSNIMRIKSYWHRICLLVLLTDYRGTVGLHRNTWPKQTSLVKMCALESTCQNECSQSWGASPEWHNGKYLPS